MLEFLIFGAMMTGVVLLVLKLDWQRIMVKIYHVTLDESLDDENNKDSKN